MVTKVKESIDAFPSAVANGMKLRDFFAAQIAAGDATVGDGWGIDETTERGKRLILARAKLYYAIADAMLEARE